MESAIIITEVNSCSKIFKFSDLDSTEQWEKENQLLKLQQFEASRHSSCTVQKTAESQYKICSLSIGNKQYS